MAEQFTDKLVQALAAPPKGNRVVYDADVRGLGVRVTKAGAKSWVLNYWHQGVERRLTIGDCNAWPVRRARERAKELRRQIDAGADPMAERHAERTAPTINDLADRFEAEHLPRKRPGTQAEYRRLLRVHIRPALGKTRVADVRHRDIEEMHRKIAATAPYVANRVAALASKMLSLAVKWELRDDNPARGVERAPEERRERFLTPAEIGRLSAVLVTHAERTSANAVRLLLLTGARKGETLAARWQDFELQAGTWIKPGSTTKQGKTHRVPLSPPALALIAEMKAVADEELRKTRRLHPNAEPCAYLFPGMAGRPIADIKHF